MSGTKIVILGKSGCGKSSMGNTILGQALFGVKTSPNSEIECQEKTATVTYTPFAPTTVIETPGFFDAMMSEEELKREIIKCIGMCASGVHVFIIVVEVGRFTHPEKNIIDKILKCFSEEALNHSAVVFTHGDQLPVGSKIEHFVAENKELKNLVKKCGCRCFVFDTKYWNNNKLNDYRNNTYQLTHFFNSIQMIMAVQGVYTNEFLQDVEKNQGDVGTIEKLLNEIDGVAGGALLGVVCGAKKPKPKPDPKVAA